MIISTQLFTGEKLENLDQMFTNSNRLYEDLSHVKGRSYVFIATTGGDDDTQG